MLRKHSTKINELIVVASMIAIFVSGCENGIVGTGEKPPAVKGGYAQKGPFEIGSSVTIVSRPGPDYLASDTYQLQTLDGIGSFEFSFQADTLYEISVTGKHFNEITGYMSADPITLSSSYFHDIGSTNFIGVNILTHMVYKRINYLVSQGMHPRTATTQASQDIERELGTTIFADHLVNFNFNKMTVYNNEESDEKANAVLLFISAAFYQQSLMYLTSPPLIDLLDFIATDLETDGIIEQANSTTTGIKLTTSLDYAARLLDPDKIVANLVKHSLETTGILYSVPDINFLLDNDGDGLNNDVDSDDDGDGFADNIDSNPYQFDIYLKPQSFNTTQGTAVKLDLQFNKPEEQISNQIFVVIDVNAAHGTITNNYPNVVYTPDLDFIGTDSFQYHVLYSTNFATILTSDKTTVTINVLK